MQIIITLNPWKQDVEKEVLKYLSKQIYIFRINCKTSITEKDFNDLFQILKKIYTYDERIKFLLDIGYPKDSIRSIIYKKDPYFEVNSGDKIRISFSNEEKDPHTVYFRTEENQELDINDEIIYGDGENIILVNKKVSNNEYIGVVQNKGLIWGNTSFHFKHEILNKDNRINNYKKLLERIPKNKVFAVALSFVENKNEIIMFRNMINSHYQITSKIESYKAFKEIHEIIKYSDILMLGRGDLLFNCENRSILKLQEEFVKYTKQYQISSIIATDILSSLLYKSIASRADILDLYMLKRLNVDYLVISSHLARHENFFRSLETINTVFRCEE